LWRNIEVQEVEGEAGRRSRVRDGVLVEGIMWKATAVLAVFAALVAAAPAFAQEDETVVLDIVLTRWGAEGEIVFVREVPIEPTLVGATCTATAKTENNSSEHPNNDFLLTSGGVTAVIPDFEAVAGETTSMTTTLVLGETITASIRLGEDGVTSEGLLVTLHCTTQPTATTTTQPPQPPENTTTTTQPPSGTTTTTQPPAGNTTTTEAPPVGGVSAGGGSSAVTGGPAASLISGGALLMAAALGLLAFARRGHDTELARNRPRG
jgi:hypothetical protein